MYNTIPNEAALKSIAENANWSLRYAVYGLFIPLVGMALILFAVHRATKALAMIKQTGLGGEYAAKARTAIAVIFGALLLNLAVVWFQFLS
jgi:hypothetical protein